MSHRLAEAIGSAVFGIYLALANVLWMGTDDPTEILTMARPIKQVHFKETRVGPGDRHPGQGRVKYAESMATLRTIGYNSWMVF
ncbi:MAG: sugar phosphate isomerase/epimerase [Phycisphaerae bacterium]|nr:sugar phosphate isomerase/epimerase [Phycisphaerae bacterium]